MHNFRVKISRYSKIIYCLQEKSTHFGLDVSLIYVMSSLYELDCFKYFIIYILGQISHNKIILNYIKSSCIIFCAQMTRYSQRFLSYIKSLYAKMFQ